MKDLASNKYLYIKEPLYIDNYIYKDIPIKMFLNKDNYVAEDSITLSEARKLLGKSAELINDTQIIELIATLTLLARNNLGFLGSKINNGILQ